MSKLLRISIFLIFFQSAQAITEKNILIFDLGGVIVDKSAFSSMRQIGLWNFFTHWYNPFYLDHHVMDFLDTLVPRHPSTAGALYKGTPMPQVLCDYMAGVRDSGDIRNLIRESVSSKQHKKSFFYKNKMIMKTAEFIFSPEALVQAIYLDTQMLELIKECHAKKNSYGESINKIYLLSNWDAESFPLLASSTLAELLRYVDGYVISYECGYIKPDPAIITYFLRKYDVRPDKQLVMFIDDQKENVTMAADFGIVPIHFKGARH